MSYVDAAGNDISQYASTPVALNASGTTISRFRQAVNIPGYTFDHIEYTTAAGVTDPSASLANLTFRVVVAQRLIKSN